ncbi:MAG TPA: YkgJ family cysteine cluster protein [Kofleriaceae bacterium]|nr:YkgJ family cysteine cluster protein [Kofleriaceae bacterium]
MDGFFARVEARHPRDMQCESGCSDCCVVRLTITEVEAGAIRDLIGTWPAGPRAVLAANVAASTTACAALDSAGRCLIYDARPIVCRSHGVPIRMRSPGSLPVVEACHRNFTERGPAAADPDCILDQTTLSALVLAADRESSGDGARIDLAKLLASATLDVDPAVR